LLQLAGPGGVVVGVGAGRGDAYVTVTAA
jgi:hypothetical protein